MNKSGQKRIVKSSNQSKLISTTNCIKTPSLLEQSNRIEQKLSHLKQKIEQKKRSSAQLKQRLPSLINPLSVFLSGIGMSSYYQKLFENGIDTIDILKDVKQIELEELGIVKGHALKIIISIKKIINQESKAQLQANQSQIKSIPTNTHQTIQPTQNKEENATTPIIEIYDTQTQSFPIINYQTVFCLFCYKKSQNKFCSANCQGHYNKMFNKYEENLIKAQETCLSKHKAEKSEEEEEFEVINNFDFLDDEMDEGFNSQDYMKMKEIIRK